MMMMMMDDDDGGDDDDDDDDVQDKTDGRYGRCVPIHALPTCSLSATALFSSSAIWRFLLLSSCQEFSFAWKLSTLTAFSCCWVSASLLPVVTSAGLPLPRSHSMGSSMR